MAETITPHTTESTFRNYSAAQAQGYAEHRSGYPPALYSYIISHHLSTGGALHTVLDLGCGPGIATREAAPNFDHAIGMDPSAQMIATAQALGGDAGKGKIEYLVGDAEQLEGIPDSSVDVITAGTSAHWFDMDKFWAAASRVLKPKGTVAIFVIVNRYPYPGMKQAAAIQSIMEAAVGGTLAKYSLKGNEITRDNYTALKLPWDAHPSVEAFDKADFVRKVWNEGGKPDADGTYFAGVREVRLSGLEKRFATSSPVTRWREANPELANTDKDCVRLTAKAIGDLFKEEDPVLQYVGPTTLLMLKRK